jgi:hypothetical protein
MPADMERYGGLLRNGQKPSLNAKKQEKNAQILVV